MSSIVQVIINKELAARGCGRLLAGDGITTLDFTIKSIGGIYAGASVDARQAKKSAPIMGSVMSTAKNLDEYYFKICNLVSSIPDSELKLNLQKYRIGIVASFSKLSGMLNKKVIEEFDKWDKYAKSLLEAAVEAFLSANNPALKPRVKSADSMEFFGVPEKTIESSLRSFYGME